MDSSWVTGILKAAKRRDEDEQYEFLALVDEAFGNCTLDAIRVLMKTFTDDPDYGTQERVVSALATADDAVVTQAILEELPRLVKDAPEWAESLIGAEVDQRPRLLEKVASSMSPTILQSLRSILSREGFRKFYPGAGDIAI
jgi:hypothetical protein